MKTTYITNDIEIIDGMETVVRGDNGLDGDARRTLMQGWTTDGDFVSWVAGNGDPELVCLGPAATWNVVAGECEVGSAMGYSGSIVPLGKFAITKEGEFVDGGRGEYSVDGRMYPDFESAVEAIKRMADNA